jgi:hypothetical protein
MEWAYMLTTEPFSPETSKTRVDVILLSKHVCLLQLAKALSTCSSTW